MNQALSFLSCLWQDFDESKVDIIASLPLEIGVMILRLLDPQALVAAILVSRRWLRVIRSDTVLRRRVYDELCREIRAFNEWDVKMGKRKEPARKLFCAEFLKRVARESPTLDELKQMFLRPVRQDPIVEDPVNLLQQVQGQDRVIDLTASAPKILPSKMGKIRPRRRNVHRPTPLRPTCIRI